MIFEEQIGIAIHVSACIGACVLVFTGVISEKDALKSIDLKVVLLFGGSLALALASALDETRAGLLIADKIVVNLMKDIQQETGTAYLLITHDLSMVKYISDRIVVLHLGHLLETGTTEYEVYR